jgi:hypothetical protein
LDEDFSKQKFPKDQSKIALILQQLEEKKQELLQQQEINRQNQTQENSNSSQPSQEKVFPQSQGSNYDNQGKFNSLSKDNYSAESQDWQSQKSNQQHLKQKIESLQEQINDLQSKQSKESTSKKTSSDNHQFGNKTLFFVGGLVVGTMVIGFFIWFLRKRN